MADLTANTEPAICNYEGTSYRANFWQGQGREYEDLAERIALRRLLPPNGRRLLDLGAGFGRLADLYDGYEQVVLLDYATSGLREAQARLAGASRFVYVAADLYHLPFAPGICDTVVTVRVLHHLSSVPSVMRAIAGILRPGGTYVLEYANKRNIKAILRYLLRRQSWSPFTANPYEFAELNYDFHPAWMKREMGNAGFVVDTGLAVSHFRQQALKRLIPPQPWRRLMECSSGHLPPGNSRRASSCVGALPATHPSTRTACSPARPVTRGSWKKALWRSPAHGVARYGPSPMGSMTFESPSKGLRNPEKW